MCASKSSIPEVKPHQCSKCTRAFVTVKGLNAHILAVGHFKCTAPGCERTFRSEIALADHLGSSVHSSQANVSTKTQNTAMATTTPIASKDESKSKISSLPFACTAPGCRKAFKTSEARKQHQESAAHKESTVVLPNVEQTDKDSVTTPGSPKESKQGGDATAPVLEGTSLSKEVKCPERSTGYLEIQTRESDTRHSKTEKAVKTRKLTPNTGYGHSKPDPLFRWDSRWSRISLASHAAILAALNSLIGATGNISAPHIKKDFCSPDFKASPERNTSSLRRTAIVLDCEMVGIGPKGSTSTLARLSAINFFTGELLIDTLVRPPWEVTDWRTQYSGITADSMDAAVASGDALKGTAAARDALFKYMDSQTILVGHALYYDLKALGILHAATVDSSLLAKAAVGKGVRKDWGLKMLCKELLGVTVQDNGKNGHDSVEDALAAREVVLWCLEHPEELRAWGARKKKEHNANKRSSISAKKKKNGAQKPKMSGIMVDPRTLYLDDSDDYEYHQSLSLQEFNELCGYPPWYDNWSD